VSSSTKYKPKLAIILSRFPYPLEKGDKLRAYHQIKDLSTEFEIHLFCTTDTGISEKQREKLRDYCSAIHVFKLNKVRQALRLLITMFTYKPFQVAYFTQTPIKKKIQKKMEELSPDYIFCQMLRVSEYVKDIHSCPKTLDFMDALSKGMERRAQKSYYPIKWIFAEEARRLQKYESKIFDYFEHQIIISKQDQTYITHPDASKIHVLSNGISDDFLKSSNSEKKYDLLFTGNMSYAPNVLACAYIHEQIKPLLDKKIKIALVGANPHRSVKSYHSEQVLVTGWVENIRTYYLASKVFLAPMFSGSGMQNKILEAMASGLPCITTNLVNNAIGAKVGEEILIAETPEDFIKQIQSLMDDDDLYTSISEKAKKFVTEKYNWKELNQKLSTIIRG